MNSIAAVADDSIVRAETLWRDLHERLDKPGEPKTEDFVFGAALATQWAVAAGKPPPQYDPVYVLYECFGPQIDAMCDRVLDDLWAAVPETAELNGDYKDDVFGPVSLAIVRALWFGLTEAWVSIGGQTTVPFRSAVTKAFYAVSSIDPDGG